MKMRTEWQLTRCAILGNMNISSSFPAFSSGTQVSGKIGVIVIVLFLLNVTFVCAAFSLKTFSIRYEIIANSVTVNNKVAFGLNRTCIYTAITTILTCCDFALLFIRLLGKAFKLHWTRRARNTCCYLTHNETLTSSTAGFEWAVSLENGQFSLFNSLRRFWPMFIDRGRGWLARVAGRRSPFG